ncbi:MAG: hypothetical protein M3137_08590 [Actinomycetota bacterium]|nr:hypothetical protein [Actinomycetota bacterium]
MAVDAFLSSPRCANVNTRRAYTAVLDRVVTEIGPDRLLADVSCDELAEILHGTWATAAPATWTRNRAALSSFLSWCAKQRYPATALPPGLARRPEAPEQTRDASSGGGRRPVNPP